MCLLWRSIRSKVTSSQIAQTFSSSFPFFSDLMSRHVNKCHANEKPPQSTGTPRRKGATSASRATTSKQACDQCVQSSLPCDGSNPCRNYLLNPFEFHSFIFPNSQMRSKEAQMPFCQISPSN